MVRSRSVTIRRRQLLALALAVAWGSAEPSFGQAAAAGERSGQALYDDGCAACHGADGRGTAPSQLGFDTPLPDFTECRATTPEPDADWLAVVHEGGPTRGFSRRMPAFKDLLTDHEMDRVVAYVRGFCRAQAWPRGDLNLPRPLFTEKAFPENEFLLTTTVDHGARAAVGDSILYERRLGARAQYEVSVPINVQKDGGSHWTTGLGDVTLAFKRVLYADAPRGRIVSAGSEVLLPTGSEPHGLGRGVTIFEPFLVAGQRLPAEGFVQAHVGFELPTHIDKADRELFVRAAAGRVLTHGRWGRSWTPMLEVLGARELARGEPALWDLVPQVQVALSRRQHIRVNAGLKFPINLRGERQSEFVSYFLWDWFDGGLFEGWK